MQLLLSDKIKKYRKEMELTQEGLADAIGVTVGAVSKWENGNTVPDIMTMMQLANFFNISMDELLGFDLTSKNVDDMCKRVDELGRKHEFDQAMIEANNAMSRYPHNFKVLYATASLYYYRYLTRLDRKDAEKAIDYFKMALGYLSQNKDPELNEYAIKSKIAYMYREIDPEKAVELLKQINYDGSNFGAIATILSENLGKIDEALEYFTYALVKSFSEMLNTVFNISSVLVSSGKKADAIKAVDMVDAELALIEASSVEKTINYTHKMRAGLLIIKACLLARLEEFDAMEKCVEEAYSLAEYFDGADGNTDIASSIKFYYTKQGVKMHDTSGVGAIEGIENILEMKIRTKDDKNNKNVKRVFEAWKDQKRRHEIKER